MVIVFALVILDPDVMTFKHDPLVGIGILYLTIESATLNQSRVVKWLTVIQQPILKFDNVLSVSTFWSYLSTSP